MDKSTSKAAYIKCLKEMTQEQFKMYFEDVQSEANDILKRTMNDPQEKARIEVALPRLEELVHYAKDLEEDREYVINLLVDAEPTLMDLPDPFEFAIAFINSTQNYEVPNLDN